MKKMNNKGFSLVELIIVIAIMAILAGAIAPALIRYIDKSRKSNDVTSCKAIKTAVETALGNESIYEFLTNNGTGGLTTIEILPGKTVTNAGVTTDYMVITGCTVDTANGMDANIGTITAKEIGTNIGEKTPKIKYKKSSGDCSVVPDSFFAFVTKKGTVYVVIGGTSCAGSVNSTTGAFSVTDGYIICPEICAEYQ
jgi:type IV pilus assembly protein PilA